MFTSNLPEVVHQHGCPHGPLDRQQGEEAVALERQSLLGKYSNAKHEDRHEKELFWISGTR